MLYSVNTFICIVNNASSDREMAQFFFPSGLVRVYKILWLKGLKAVRNGDLGGYNEPLFEEWARRELPGLGRHGSSISSSPFVNLNSSTSDEYGNLNLEVVE